MTTATRDRIARAKSPLYGQKDLRYLKDMLERMLAGRNAIKGLPRSLTAGEVEFLARCAGLRLLIRELATGDLTVERSTPEARNGRRQECAQLPLELVR